MVDKAKRKTVIQPRDQFVLKHVARYTVTTMAALTTIACFEDSNRHIIKNVIRRLRNGGYLASSRYVGGTYYYLTKRGGAAIGEDQTVGKPLKPEPLIRAIAIITYCCLSEPKQSLITTDEFKRYFPDCWRPGIRVNYYIDTTTEQPRLSFVRVDFGKTHKANQLLHSCNRDIAKLLNSPGFTELQQTDQLQLTVISGMPKRKERLDRMLELLDEKPALPIKTVAIEALLEMIAPYKF